MARVNRHPNELRMEKLRILYFCSLSLRKDRGTFTFVSDLCGRYNALFGADLSPDSFGRLLPRMYKRKVICSKGNISRAILDYSYSEVAV